MKRKLDGNRIPVMQKPRKCGQYCLLFTGIFLISLSSGIFIFFEQIYEFIINYNLSFNPTSRPYLEWENSPPVESTIYLFNWTNPSSIKNVSTKPEFEEIGPYRFYELRGKSDVTWFDDYVDYKTYTRYFADNDKIGRNLSDVINSVNTVAFSVGYQSRFEGYWVKKMISVGVASSGAKLHVTKTASELLFKGYHDPILGVLSKVPFVQAPKKGGLFFGRNNTAGLDGKYSMHFKNDERFGEVLLWNDKNRTKFYQGQCNDIRGSAGEFFPINQKRDKITMFSSDLCKSLVLHYVEDVSVKGVHGYKYSAQYGFDNGTVHSENACYCNGECLPTGVFNVSSCRQDSPTFLSFPHFFNADPFYRNAVKGMKPNKTLHEFYIILEPKSGIIMEVQAPMQVNMLLHPVTSISLFSKVPKVFMPVFYIMHEAHLTDEIADGLRMLQSLPQYCNYFFYTAVTIGAICLSVALFSIFYCKNSKLEGLGKNKYGSEPVKNNPSEQLPLNEKADLPWTYK